MSGADLVAARYPTTYPYAKAIGVPGQVGQANLTPRSNAEFPFLGTLADGALAATEVGCVIAVPVEVGDTITKITLPVGATKGKKVEAGFAAVYQALNAKLEAKEQPLLAQSKSAALAETVEAEKPLVFTLETPVAISSAPALAPYGFVYVVIALEAETMPTAATFSTPKAVQVALAKTNPNGPVVFGGTAGTGLKTKAEATLGTVTSKAVTPCIQVS